MIYDTPKKGEDGMYHVRALTEERKRYLIQLTGVKVSDIDTVSGEVSFEVIGEDNQAKLENIHESNIQSAIENSKEWFGKELPDKTITNAYMKDEELSVDCIDATRVFDLQKKPVELDTLTKDNTCSIFVEFSGLWFAKKAFGPSWNLVQVKIHEEEKPPPPEPKEEHPVEAYPEEYMFEDEVTSK
jgi:hypothetical protein